MPQKWQTIFHYVSYDFLFPYDFPPLTPPPTIAAEALLHHGADVDNANDGGGTPLFAAAANGRLEVVEAVLYNGAAVDRATNHGATALYMAAQLSCTTMYRDIAAP